MSAVVNITDGENGFLEKITGLSGEKITSCIQCGVCSASCPMINEMDLMPSQIMSLSILGQKERLLTSRSIWICASCLNCKVRCPRELDLAKVAESLRQVALRRAVDRIDIKAIPQSELMELPQIAIVGACRRLTG